MSVNNLSVAMFLTSCEETERTDVSDLTENAPARSAAFLKAAAAMEQDYCKEMISAEQLHYFMKMLHAKFNAAFTHDYSSTATTHLTTEEVTARMNSLREKFANGALSTEAIIMSASEDFSHWRNWLADSNMIGHLPQPVKDSLYKGSVSAAFYFNNGFVSIYAAAECYYEKFAQEALVTYNLLQSA